MLCVAHQVDYAAAVDESLLNRLGVSKGGRRVINVEERGTALELLAGCDSVVSAGGSLANTLVGMSRLAAAQARAADKDVVAPHMQPRVAMAGCVGGGDALGEFARAQLGAAGVAVAGSASPPGGPTDGATGVVMVLTTPDAQRSFLSSFSPDDALTASPELLTAVADSRLLLLEGYLWELPGAQAALPALLDAATAARHSGNGHASGSAASNGSNAAGLVALTAGDASVIARHGAAVLGALTRGVDLFLANADEALALVQHLDCLQEQAANVTSHENAAHSGSASTTLAAAAAAAADPEMIECLERLGSASLDDDIVSGGEQVASFVGGVAAVDVPAAAAALRLATLCPLVAVTDGAHGSYIAAAGGRLLVVPPYWRAAPPRDTCGAGDAYAAGLLHGLLQGLELPAAGQLAARTASAVISRHGPQLTADDADWALMMPGGARRTAASGVVVAGGAAQPSLGGLVLPTSGAGTAA